MIHHQEAWRPRVITTTALKKTFKTPAGELEILKGIDLKIEAGEFVSVVGASGVGKSTLMHILGTLDRPTSGTLFIGGRNVTEMDEAELTAFRNRTVGFVFQFHHLLPEFTILENAMMPALIGGEPHSAAEGRAEAILKTLGLSHRLTHRPGEVSGGEQQRVAVARALVMGPRVVLADEPTGNLDTRTGGDLFDLLSAINREQGTTFVMVTHNEALSGRCSRVIEMRDGMITG
jgi:lipoprotein-releasing system ATP-binding protein